MEILVYQTHLWKKPVRLADCLDITGLGYEAIATVMGTNICLPVDQDFALNLLRTSGCAYVGQPANDEWAKVSSRSDGALYFDGIYDDKTNYTVTTVCCHCGATTTSQTLTRDYPTTKQGSYHPWATTRVRHGLGFNGSAFTASDIAGALTVTVGPRHKALLKATPGHQFWSGKYKGTSYTVLAVH